MVIAQGDVCWADLPAPVGSGPGFRRPVVVVQGDAFNRSRIATAVCVPLTSNLAWADAPGNLLLRAATTNLPKDSVANVSQIVTLDRSLLLGRVGRLSRDQLELLFSGIDVVLGRAAPPEGPSPTRPPGARRSRARPRARRARSR
jgi:mRNA interferase MazF